LSFGLAFGVDAQRRNGETGWLTMRSFKVLFHSSLFATQPFTRDLRNKKDILPAVFRENDPNSALLQQNV
jgi:hypothetical protein